MNKIMAFFLIFPFIYPIGLDNIPILKKTIIVWQILAILVMFYNTHFRIKKSIFKSWTLIYVVVFHFAMLVTTLLITGSIDEGFRKIFIYPFAFIVAYVYFKKNRDLFLAVCIRIIWIEEVINVIFWNNTSLFNGYFLGIRTYFPIFGLFVFYIAFMCQHYSINNTKFYSYTSVIMSVAFVFLESVSTGIVVYALLFLLLIMINNRKFEKVLNVCDSKKLIPIAVFLNISIVFMNAIPLLSNIISGVLGETTTLTGRTYLWIKAIQEIKMSPIYGYGVYGKYIQLEYWNNALNYMHNELLQIMLDGGIILLFIFVMIIISLIRTIDSKEDYKINKVETGLLFSMLVVMITEVPTFYSVFYVMIGIMAQTLVKNSSC